MRLTIPAAALALLAGTSSHAQVGVADQISYSVPMPSVNAFAFLEEGDFGGGESYPITGLPLFDPAMGELVDVQITFDLEVEVFADIFGEGILNTGVTHTVGWSLGQLAVGVTYTATALEPTSLRLLGEVEKGFGAGCVGNPGDGEACSDFVGTTLFAGGFEVPMADDILLDDFVGIGEYAGFEVIVDFLDSNFDLFNIATAVAEISAFSFNEESQFTITYFYVDGMSVDTDGDGVDDSADNCVEAPNADQTDTDGDGYGNACDADVNNDCVVNVIDLGILRTGFFGTDPLLDFNGDGVVNVTDLGLMRVSFFGTPGPSGIGGACDDDQSRSSETFVFDAKDKRYNHAR